MIKIRLLFIFFSQALYNEYVHFKETEIPSKEAEKGNIEHLYKLLEVRNRRKMEKMYREKRSG